MNRRMTRMARWLMGWVLTCALAAIGVAALPVPVLGLAVALPSNDPPLMLMANEGDRGD